MYWQGAAALLLGASRYIPQVTAQVITITQYPSTCSAIYTSGSRSVTVVQSTVTVSPVPWNDNMANGGSYFVLQALLDTTGQTKRQAAAPRWVLPNGYLTTDGTKAAQYMIKNSQLTTSTGGWISTYEGIPYGTFGVSSTIGDLNTTFTITDGKLVWSNTAFTDGVAKLCQTPDGAQDPPHIVARFYGAPVSSCVPYTLYARPVNAATEGTSPPPGMSSTAIVSSMGVGMSSMQPPVSASPYQTPTYTGQASTGGQGGQTASSYGGGGVQSSRGGQYNPSTTGPGTQPASSAAQSPPAVSSSSLPTSSEGICGNDSGFVCSGSDCCGTYGYCGTGADYCGDGCQPGFGTCWSASSSSMAMTSDVIEPTSYPPDMSISESYSASESMSMSMSESLPMYSPPASGTESSSATPAITGEPVPTYAICPDDDGMIITDGSEKQYTIGCGKDTTIGMYASDTVSGGFNECFELCDYRPDCTAFTYLGSVDGVGPGICYYKDEQVDFVAVTNGERMVSGIRVMDDMGSSMSSMAAPSTLTASIDPPASGYSTYTATGTPIAPDNPGGPQSRTSSSASMDTSVASSMMGVSTPSLDMMATFTPSQMMASSTSSSAAAAATSLCPGANGTMYTDPGGNEYTLLCGMDFAPGSVKILPEDSLSACINACVSQTDQVCVGVSFGAGLCQFKASLTVTSSSSGVDSAVLSYMMESNPPAYSASSASMMSSSMMSSASSSRSSSGMMSSSPSSSGSMSSSMPMSTSMSMSVSGTPSMTSTSSSSPSATHPVSSNGHCGTQGNGGTSDGFTCTDSLFGDCCSSSGFCGYSSDYCLAGCQSEYGECSPQDGNPITVSGECGPDWSNTTCTGGQFGACCSTSGFCGSSADYCAAENCDPMFGICDAASSTSMMSSTSMSSSRAPPTTTTTTSRSSSSSPAITTTTSTTRTTTTTTSTSSSSSAYLVLPSPTPCDFGDPVGYDEDDSYCKITLPFSMQIYTQSDTNTFAATNGYLSLTYGSSQFASQQFPASNIPNNTVAPFFDDLYLDGSESPRQGIFYQIQSTAVTYEWYVGRGGIPGNVYHFTVRYDSAVPGVFTYTYYSTGGPTDQGEYASVGAQGKNAAGAAVGTTYAYHTQEIPPGLVVVCNTNLNTCVTKT